MYLYYFCFNGIEFCVELYLEIERQRQRFFHLWRCSSCCWKCGHNRSLYSTLGTSLTLSYALCRLQCSGNSARHLKLSMFRTNSIISHGLCGQLKCLAESIIEPKISSFFKITSSRNNLTLIEMQMKMLKAFSCIKPWFLWRKNFVHISRNRKLRWILVFYSWYVFVWKYFSM